MRGAALSLESEIRTLAPPPDVLVTTDFMNLSELLALTRDLRPRPLPAVVYFHENQLTYPAASADVRDIHFGLVNVYSALAADRVLFNSAHHMEVFLEAAEELLDRMPDFRPEGVGERIRRRSEVLGLPIDLEEMDGILGAAGDHGASHAGGVASRAGPGAARPLVLWNHRWEDDRNPDEFFSAMERLGSMAREGRAPEFALAVVGQTYQACPAAFDRARGRLAERIVHWGFVESRREYLEILSRSAVVVSTSRHEFFGVSVREAIYMGCAPVLPRRLTYPEIACGLERCLYDNPAEIPAKVASWLSDPDPQALAPLRAAVKVHDSSRVVARWDEILESVVSNLR